MFCDLRALQDLPLVIVLLRVNPVPEPCSCYVSPIICSQGLRM